MLIDRRLKIEEIDVQSHEPTNFVLIDLKDWKTILEEKMSAVEAERRNTQARRVGEYFLMWLPSLSP